MDGLVGFEHVAFPPFFAMVTRPGHATFTVIFFLCFCFYMRWSGLHVASHFLFLFFNVFMDRYPMV